ncbi:hypothetical protein N7492_009738 [Penicillium capsulatum]|uniref:Uncharacterized protein n=1 Tax=Penicillium capsulatum TaxID=69766 RepID=A0A9W9HJ78_9EURO|nr:hypothetical protein N7492_010723 [Penicillium capsulatum]KAJ5152458.1 hypothetical protein N7492_009738 [Penicillium capsulatum]KAJ6114056.1 hypothetical protein N7512_007501 [Penicillium capsulatum]KAJ6114179.1 hypothetical protein N7512_007624 [Penicillium capsulatum]
MAISSILNEDTPRTRKARSVPRDIQASRANPIQEREQKDSNNDFHRPDRVRKSKGPLWRVRSRWEQCRWRIIGYLYQMEMWEQINANERDLSKPAAPRQPLIPTLREVKDCLLNVPRSNTGIDGDDKTCSDHSETQLPSAEAAQERKKQARRMSAVIVQRLGLGILLHGGIRYLPFVVPVGDFSLI